MITGQPYEPGSWQDRLVESFSGPHDAFNALHYYDQYGNILSNRDFWNSVNVLLTAPMGLATFCSQMPGFCDVIKNIDENPMPSPDGARLGDVQLPSLEMLGMVFKTRLTPPDSGRLATT